MKAMFYSNKGPVRTVNQDGLFIVDHFVTDTDAPQLFESSGTEALFAVIDGMGGMGRGEVAAKIIGQNLANADLSPKADCALIESILRDSALELRKAGAGNNELAKMGATIAGLWLAGDYALVFNCGDSRVYQSRSGFLQKRSHDHSLVQELFDSGAIEEDEMRAHPHKNVVTSAISADNLDSEIFCVKIQLQTGNKFLLCSDGLWEALPLEEMEQIMSHEMESAAQLLMETAFANNAKDNFSFIIVQC